MVSMEIYTLVVLIVCFSVISGTPTATDSNNGASCYDCQYAPQGRTKDDRGRWVVNTYSGFTRCALANGDDAYFVNKWVCESERCFIRKDPNGQIFRGCADQWNLPWGTDTNQNCSRQGYSGAIWWFCDGHLCNDGSLEGSDRCGALAEQDTKPSKPPRYNPITYKSPVLNDGSQNSGGNPEPEFRPRTTQAVPETAPPPTYNTGALWEEETVHGMNYYDNTSPEVEYYYDTSEYEDEDEDENPIIQDNPQQIQKPVTKFTSSDQVKNTYHGNTYNPYVTKVQKGPYQYQQSYVHNQGVHNHHSTPHSNSHSHYSHGNHGQYGNNFWSRLWRRGASQYRNPHQAQWRYPYTSRNPHSHHSTVHAGARQNTYPAHQHDHHHHQTHHYNPHGSNTYHSRNTNIPAAKTYSQVSPPTQQYSGSSYSGRTKQYSGTSYGGRNYGESTYSENSQKENSYNQETRQKQEAQYHQEYKQYTTTTHRPWTPPPTASQDYGVDHGKDYGRQEKTYIKTNKTPNIKLKVIPVEDEEARKKKLSEVGGALSEKQFTEYYDGLNLKHENTYAEYDDSNSAPNPCGMSCNGYPGTIHPDPTRNDHFIQCGPGTRYGETCKCCHPNYLPCPQGTTFDDMHKVCNQVGSHNVEDRKYKTIDFYAEY